MTRVVALIPAHNEAGSIAATIEAVLAQDRVPDDVVVIPNGCSDDTAEIARAYPVTVLELPALPNRKSEALNIGWTRHGADADVVVSMDADTILPPNAVADWLTELADDEWAGGSSSKFTTVVDGYWPRMQKSEYAAWAQMQINHEQARVLSGTGSAFRGEVLRIIADRDDREGPWSYRSVTEDYELTYRIRELGYRAGISPTVRAYTDAMPTIRSLWGQRLKWQVGTVQDLLAFGWNRLTWRDWGAQAMGLLALLTRLLWVGVTAVAATLGVWQFMWWWLAIPALVIAIDLRRARRIPHCDWKDWLIAATFVPNELFQWFRAALFAKCWTTVAVSRITKRQKDMWAAQYALERS